MSYLIYTSSGTVLTTVATGKLNTSTVSITLVGRNTPNYGQYFNQNFVELLSNFASPSYLPPQYPIEGQLWFDSTSGKLKIYTNSKGFELVNAPVISNTQPIGQLPGEFWYDPDAEKLNFLSSNGQYVSMTTFPITDDSGWVHSHNNIVDVNSNTVQVTILKNYGAVLGALTTASFTASVRDSVGTFIKAGVSNFTAVDGLTIIGDIRATEKLVSSTLLSPNGPLTLTTNGTENWIFETGGTLLLPNSSTISLTDLNLDITAGSPPNPLNGAGGHIKLSGADAGDIGGDATLQGGNSPQGIGGSIFITAGTGLNPGQIEITSNENTWVFRDDGLLTLPNGALINSSAISTSSVAYYDYDAASLTVAVTPSTTIDFPNFSGQILINDHIDGQVELWLAGGAYAYRLGSSKTGNGDQTLGAMSFNSGIQGYTWTSSITGTMVFVATRTRSEA